MMTQSQLAAEHSDHVFNAQYDDIRERYAAEIRDLEMYAQSEQEYYEYMWKVSQAGFGEDYTAYEAQWERTLQYYSNLKY